MTKKQKSAKRAFLSSFLSFVMFFTMFAGTTYAWYNDSVTSGRNTIVSGSLEMTIQYYVGPTDDTADFDDDDNWEKVTSETKIFPEINNKLTFEPGAVRVSYVRVKNEGDLAFKYNLVAVAENEKAGESQTGATILLSNILKFGKATVDEPFGTREAAITAIGSNVPTIANAALSDGVANLAKGATSDVIALVIYMPSDVGDEANPKPDKKPEISFGLNAVASQYTVENDSFSNDYDENANMPAIANQALSTNATVNANNEATFTSNAVPDASSVAGTTKETTVAITSVDANANDNLTLTVKTQDLTSASNTTTYSVTDGSTAVAGIDLTLEKNGTKVTFDGGTATITTYIVPGLDAGNITVKYNGTGDNGTVVSYDPATGKLVFTATHFSEYYVEYAGEWIYYPGTGKAYKDVFDFCALAEASVANIHDKIDIDAIIEFLEEEWFGAEDEHHALIMYLVGDGYQGTGTPSSYFRDYMMDFVKSGCTEDDVKAIMNAYFAKYEEILDNIIFYPLPEDGTGMIGIGYSAYPVGGMFYVSEW